MSSQAAGVFIAIVFMVTVVTVVGHGLWLFIAWLLRGGQPKSSAGPRCPGCNADLELHDGHCVSCGWPKQTAGGLTLSAERTAVERQIEQWRRDGVIDDATRERLQATLETGQRRPAAPAAPPSAPVPATPKPAAPPADIPPVIARTATPLPKPHVVPSPSAQPAAPPKPAAADPFRDVDKWETPPTAAATAREAAPPPVIERRPVAPPPPPPSKPFAEVLAAFMEEKHIRWGELIGGLLIVGCSVALVISFWTQIAQFKFYLFTAVTAALFGLGFYSERRWKLPTTSSGVLLIATLLVPLNFLAIAAFSEGTAHFDLLGIVRELAALALFAWLVQRAAGVLAPRWPALLTAGVLGSSLVQLLVRRLELSGVGVPMLLTLGVATLVSYAGPVAAMLRRARQWKETGAAEVNALLGLLGMLTFTALLPLGLLIYKTGNIGWALQQLAPLFCLGGTPALAAGLMIWRRATGAELAGKRTAGTGAAVAGALLMVAGTVLAWPQPSGIVPVALVDFAVLTAVAWLFEIPAAHLLAVPCLALAYLVGFHAVTGHVRWSGEESSRLFDALFSATSGNALVALAALLAASGAWLARAGRAAHANVYLRATGIVAVASVALVTWFGFGRAGDPHGATWVYALYAVAALGAAWRTQRGSVVWTASALMFAALAQGLVFRFEVDFGWRLALLVHSTMAVVLVFCSRRREEAEGSSAKPPVCDPLSCGEAIAGSGGVPTAAPLSLAGPRGGGDAAAPSYAFVPMSLSALASSCVAVIFILAGAETTTAATSATHTFWLAAVWLAAACLRGWPVLFTAFQAALALAVVFAAVAGIEHRAWFTAARHPWVEPWTIQTISVALALLSGAWVAARLFLRRTEVGKKANHLLNPPWPTPDRILMWAVFGGAAAMALCGTWPDVARETDESRDVVAGSMAMWQAHALGFGSWLLLGATLAVMAARLWERFEKRLALAGATGLFIACWLLAGRWNAELATASALRWLLAGGLVLGSCFVWCRERLMAVTRSFGWPEVETRADGLAGATRGLLMMLGIVPVLALTLPATFCALGGQAIPLPAAESLFARMGVALSYTVPMAVIALVMAGHGARERSAGWTFASGLAMNLTVSLGWLLAHRAAGGGLGTAEWVRLAQFNAATFAGVALSWLGARTALARHDSDLKQRLPDNLLSIQTGLALFVNGLLLVIAGVQLFFHPVHPGAWVVQCGRVWGWLALVAAAVASAWLARMRGEQLGVHSLGAGLLAMASLLAFGAARWDTSHHWLAYHTWLVAVAGAAWAMLLTNARRGLDGDARWWIKLLGAMAVALALRACGADAGRPWWSVSALAAMGALGATMAWRTRRAGWLYAGALLFNLAVSVWWMTGRAMNSPVEWTRFLQFNGITTAAMALAWLAARAGEFQRDSRAELEVSGGWLKFQVALGLVGNLLLIGPGTFALAILPHQADRMPAAVGGLWGWLNVALTMVAAVWAGRLTGARFPVHAVFAGLLGGASLLACSVCQWDKGDWLGFHTLLAAYAASAWLAFGVGLRRSEWEVVAVRWMKILGALTVLLALRGFDDDPARPWWSVGGFVAMSTLAVTIAVRRNGRGWLYVAGPLLNLATTCWLLARCRHGALSDLVEANVIALALPALAWLALELRVFARNAQAKPGLPAFHHVASLVSAMVVAAITASGLFADATGGSFRADALLGWLALGATAVLMTVCLWDAGAAYVVGGLYALGLVAAGMTLDQFNLSPRWLLWGGVMAGGAYTLATSALWNWRAPLMEWAAKFGVPPRAESSAWLARANLALAATVVVMAFSVALTFAELLLRLQAATAALAQAVAVGLLAHGERKARLQRTALWLGVIGAVAWGWAWLEPGASGNLLHRVVVVMTAVAAMTALYGAGMAKLIRRENDWTEAARGMVKPLLSLALATLALVIVMEILYTINGERVPMTVPAILAVTAAILATVFACIVFAVVPGRDPLGLSERGRMAYVYAAEVLVALVFVHLRLTAPWLFQHHIFRRYWPIIIMALSFLGIGLSELFRRQNRLVLAEPLERTGAFLPLLPVLGFWVAQPQMHYSVLLLLVGGLYAALSVMRRSFAFGLMAALAANGSLWYLLHRIEGLGFWQHPQFWLVPVSVSALAAAWLNRDRLSAEQTTTVRYIAGMTLYVSSTADIFINGVSVAPWLPFVLAVLSIAGILAGMAMRVRAFLYLGASFLVLALLAMIWHAAVNLQQTWVWYVSGIVLGALIIAIFAVFEKKRADILRLVDGLKQWEK
jgi:hypothetical protein